jgi:hypothetical protein
LCELACARARSTTAFRGGHRKRVRGWIDSGGWIGRSKQKLIETARAGLPRELTDEERRRFHLAVK